MADPASIVRVAKILARATSPEPQEASAALQGAYKRMVRDGVTLSDLLSLPLELLYQDTLVKLVEVILAAEDDLSPAAKREAYAEYIRLIVVRFSETDRSAKEQGSSSRADESARSRAEEAREYEERRRRHEEARRQSEQGRAAPDGDSEAFSQENSETLKRQDRYFWKVGRVVFSFSPAAFFYSMRPIFGRGSLLWYSAHDPLRALRLFAASLLWGVGFAAVALTVVAIAHALLGVGPWIDVKLKSAFAFLSAIGTLWKARLLVLGGWFR